MFNSTSRICIFGMSGSGKSTLCRNLQKYFLNVFIFDTLNEYSEKDVKGNVFREFKSFSQFVVDTKDKNGIRAVFQFDIENHNNAEIFDECVRLLYFRGNCTIVIEEVQNFANVHNCPPYLKQVSLTGRHKDISFITTTQRIAECHKTILSQAHHRFTGYCDNPTDKRTLKDWGIPEDHIEKIDLYEFIWKDGKHIYWIDNKMNFINSKN